ncbi:aminotransferase class V-fold PLP-dependent enzyme [Myxococcota bacterium]|nr:aminotransferase class V-fold PLP-dependent enzyme [Myxococcota bacterium]
MSSAAPIDALATRLRPHYSRFLDPIDARGEILLTGHSHQAWPDVARDGQIEAWDDAARFVDDKWDRVFGELIPELQRHVAMRLGSSRPTDLALGQNTHELVYRLASCFPPNATVVTTDSEFHSLRRQLTRFEEDGARIVRVPVDDARTFAGRFLDAVRTESPAWVALSYVLFTTSRVITELPEILAELAKRDVPVLVDVYHAFNVLTLDVDRWPGRVFVTGGGYKYAQSGEGVCWMLLPEAARTMRPRQTGWFSHFAGLDGAQGAIDYGDGGARFLGSTFDPTSVYRAVHVMRFFEREGLTPAVLTAQSQAQTGVLMHEIRRAGLNLRGLELATPDTGRGGFVTLRTPRAAALKKALRAAGVHTDVRGELLRLGPAPYLRTEQLEDAVLRLASLA